MVDPTDVRAVLADYLPAHPAVSVQRFDSGLDNIAFRVDDELIVRFRRDDPGGVDREAALLAVVADVSPLPVPEPLIVDPARGVLAYRILPGVPLLELPIPSPAAVEGIAEALGGLLAALHAVPAERVAGLVELDNDPLPQWLAEAGTTWPAVAPHVPVERRPAVERWLADPPPDTAVTTVFSHQDLGIEHVLVDPVTWAVRGIIDWSDAAIGDPAYDLGLILRDLGPRGLDAALRDRGGADAALRDRAVFHARCGLIENLAYGLQSDRRAYVDKSLAAMAWLF